MNRFRAPIASLFASASIAALVCPAVAAAQDAADETEQGNAGGLNEIVVTADKRTENLQEVPIAISAVQAADLELRGLTEAKDLSAVVPNVVVSGATTNATASVITIRGIPTAADETQGYDSPIGVYLDGVYLARSSASTFEVADIERVEVLRGPQGTLFGRNTTGGAINFITRLPEDETRVKLRAGYGNYNAWNVRALVDTGLWGDSGVKMSFGYLHRERDGVVDNILEPDDSRDPGGINVDSFRWATQVDRGIVSFTNTFDYTVIEGVTFANQLAEVGDGTFRPNVTIDGFQFAQVQPANLRAFLGTATPLQPQCGAPLDSVSRERLDKICLDQAGVSTDKLYGNMTRVELGFDPFTVRSTTAFRWWNNKIRGSDLDGLGGIRGPLFSQASLFNGMPANLIAFVLPPAQAAFAPFIAATPVPTTTNPLFQAENNRRQRQFSQEVEIISQSGGAFEWVLGAFYFKESGYELNRQNFLFVLDTNQAVFTDASFGPLGAAFRAANPARYRALPQTSTLGYDVSGRSIAVYGQATWRPGGPDAPFGITAGLRYTWDKKWVDRFQNGLTPYTNPAEIALNTGSVSFSEPTGHVTLDYRAAEDINLYARVARGYRSGGFNLRQSTQLDNPATPNVNEAVGLIPFNSEKIDSFEIGAKTEFFNRLRLNAAAFYNVYNDQQATIPIPIVGGGSFGTQVVNAGKTVYKGFEIEGRLAITDAFTADGSLGYVHKDVKEFPGADITGTIRNIGDVIVPGYSPNYTANAGLTYSAPVGNSDMRLTARAGWSYVSSQVQFNNPLTAPFQEATSSEAHSLFDAQIKLDGIGFGNSDNGLSLILWGKNLTDKEYVSRAVDFGQLGMGTTIYGEPRTYGVTAELTF
ncbi:TonB-dependent receptor [Altererythrobacter aerius]|uniref:TonB-dependent receptor n=1 Tax=Tsuneonella aeria TaxID=1837929 RepID=A0A6I4TCL8_9SPHN|nr:TonB-dependent receptor [Tsuneonella aeria]MXO74346.1 TonB-dependent receptor [Tsuneonella aeria]